MTIKELIARLREMPNLDTEVFVAIDEEGNGYHPLVDLGLSKNIDENAPSKRVLVIWP